MTEALLANYEESESCQIYSFFWSVRGKRNGWWSLTDCGTGQSIDFYADLGLFHLVDEELAGIINKATMETLWVLPEIMIVEREQHGFVTIRDEFGTERITLRLRGS